MCQLKGLGALYSLNLPASPSPNTSKRLTVTQHQSSISDVLGEGAKEQHHNIRGGDGAHYA